jgi:hypothetical protein
MFSENSVLSTLVYRLILNLTDEDSETADIFQTSVSVNVINWNVDISASSSSFHMLNVLNFTISARLTECSWIEPFNVVVSVITPEH